MKSKFPLVVLLVALATIVAITWEPVRARVGLLSPFPSPSPAASPTLTPSPQAPVVDEPAPEATAEPTPELPRARFDKCVDGSALTVTSADSNQTNYKCESGANGAYLNR